MASMILLGAVIILLNLASMSLAQPKHRCRTHCGDIEIPYPCGIAIGCAIEQRFEVNCSRTVDGIERPFIHEQEVLNISASRGQSRVLMTIPSYCYNSSTAKMDLRPWDFYLAWPYRFLDVQNKSISIGCNSMGYIYTGKSRYVAGCISVCCSPDELANGSCIGIGCCQNTITMGLTSYHAVFYDVDYLNSTTSWHFNPCGYSMVVEAENFVFNSVYNHDKGIVLEFAPIEGSSNADSACPVVQLLMKIAPTMVMADIGDVFDVVSLSGHRRCSLRDQVRDALGETLELGLPDRMMTAFSVSLLLLGASFWSK
ncbi:unnamed protein product [Triticum turgidum subsp. durum]|uniref:Wall-associated receptor kinase galacturonan-binding domain-containing protein n=1 Tax=Triticum turgidum subsp. durum TaxID=4567 RepID=A0A9R0TXR7_TRITD|nr:unnamed protein product [Triticum turgidum subsp. durum]